MSTTLRTQADTTTWKIDPAHTQVEFSVKHMMFTTVRGSFGAVEGTIALNEQTPARSSVTLEIDATSITTGVDARDQHLRSAEFFDVETFPALTFRSRRIEGTLQEGERFRLVGDLTIRDVTREVALDVTWDGRGKNPWGAEVIGFTAETAIDRRDYGLNWNAALEAGGVLVSNEVKISLAVQATLVD